MTVREVKAQYMYGSSLPVVVSIATVPSRIDQLRPTIDSLLTGMLVPDKILIVHPYFCKWEGSTYNTPAFLADSSFCRGIVENVISTEDWGPGTKILGVIDHLPHDCYLILADDDVEYHPRFVMDLIGAQSRKLNCSFSYYTYRASGLRFGQGCDGYSFYSPNLSGINDFAIKNVAGTSLLYHDDLWIGFFLYEKGIKIQQIPTPIPGELVYKQLLPNDILSSQTTGNLARDNIFRESLPRLIRHSNMSNRKLILLRLNQAYDAAEILMRKVSSKFTKIFLKS